MKTAGKGFLFFLLVLALFTLGFSWRDLQGGSLPRADLFRQLVGLSPGSGASKSATEVFKESFDTIRAQYAKPVDTKKLKYAGLAGMMASLGDPHTQFLSPQATDSFKLETDGQFAGVGARLSPDPLGARVASVFEDGPANRAGLRKDDLITAVNGDAVGGMNIDSIVGQIRGEPGTWVTLRIVRKDTARPLSIRIKRARVTTPTVESRVLGGTRVGYLAISMFSQPTGDQFFESMAKLEKQGIKGLVIDVRDNPGGLLDTAVDMLSRFMEDKIVVKMKLRNGKEEVARTISGFKQAPKYPVVILINEDSASAAEIFSGVMRDYRLATLVGTHTYGKASVQNVIQLIDGASAKITVAKYFLPSGNDISRKVDSDGIYVSGGIDPDILSKWPMDHEGSLGDEKTDPQLKRALSVIKSKIGPSTFLLPGEDRELASALAGWVVT